MYLLVQSLVNLSFFCFETLVDLTVGLTIGRVEFIGKEFTVNFFWIIMVESVEDFVEV